MLIDDIDCGKGLGCTVVVVGVGAAQPYNMSIVPVLAPGVPERYAGRGIISITTENIFGFLILWLQLFHNG